jgi:acyl-CoA synthetase (AMP-forming)/AMP-acid ligase II
VAGVVLTILIAERKGGTMRCSTLADLIRQQGSQRPDQAAFVYGARTLSFGDLDTRSSQVANGLRSEGVGSQERVAFLDKNSPEFFEVLFGAAKLNAVMVAVNCRLAPREAAYIVNDADAKVLVVGEELLPVAEAMEAELTTVKKVVVVGHHHRHETYDAWLARQAATDPDKVGAPDDVALQLYSSGTTGLPKGVMLTHDSCLFSFAQLRDTLTFSEHSVSLVVMPLFHVVGACWALMGLRYGLTAVLERDADPVLLVRTIGERRISHMVVVPAVLQFMLDVPAVDEADFSSLECVVYGGSPISEAVVTRAVRVFGQTLVQGYGMTETGGAVALLGREDHDPGGPLAHRLRAAGRPMGHCRIRIADPETLADCPRGKVGEILVHSRQNMKGYWKLPDATAATLLPDGWLRTGDAGYVDEDGYLYIHDRVKDMIISGGENVYPAEVESVLMAHPGVADVAVVGVPSERWGETPKAFVVRVAGTEVNDGEIIDFARRNLAGYKCPTSVEWRMSLPRNPTGKLLKKELRAPYWAATDRQVH